MSKKMLHNTKPPDSQVQPGYLTKTKTGISGLDEVLHGGFPLERTIVIKGSAGTGKTILGLEFLVHSAHQGEPAIFVSFEESAETIRQNARATGWDISELENAGALFLWQAKIDRNTLISGDFSIESLLAALEGKARQMGAKLIMIDAVDVLMRIFQDPQKEQNELYRLHDWLTEQQFTAILTAKVGKQKGYEHGYEILDYTADCVLFLDFRVMNQVATRRLRVIKYRGSGFYSNEYPYIITAEGNVIMPVSGVQLLHKPLGKIISSGDAALDKALGGGFRHSACILVSGPTGCGKTTLAATFAEAHSSENNVLYISFEESAEAIMAAMQSPGIDLKSATLAGNLDFYTIMPEALVSEEHLYRILKRIDLFQPDAIIVDAISACKRMGTEESAFDFLVRLINICKQQNLTCLLTNQLADNDTHPIHSGIGISSLVDTLMALRYITNDGRVQRELTIMKSCGMHHSDRRHLFAITDHGIRINSLQNRQEED